MMILKIYLIAVLLTFIANFLMFLKFGVPKTENYSDGLNDHKKEVFVGGVILATILPIVSTLAMINAFKKFGGSK